MIIHKTTYDFNNKFIVELVKTLQFKDKFFIKIKANEAMNKQKDVKA